MDWLDSISRPVSSTSQSIQYGLKSEEAEETAADVFPLTSMNPSVSDQPIALNGGRVQREFDTRKAKEERKASVFAKPKEQEWKPEYEKEPELEHSIVEPDTWLGPGSLGKAAAVTGKAAAPWLAKISTLAGAAGGVIKAKGGNWAEGSVEGTLKSLKRPIIPMEPNIVENEQLKAFVEGKNAERSPINNWIDKQLTKYVKNEMGTPEDPVRVLAEGGRLHYEPADYEFGGEQMRKSSDVAGVLGRSNLAKRWENASDSLIQPKKIDSPYRPGEKMVQHEISGFSSQDPVSRIGFDSLIDDLAVAIDPESELPKNLQLKPESLQRLSVPQAVEHAAKINDWRKAEAAKTSIAQLKNATVTKEFEDGYKWIEIPDTSTPKGMKMAKAIGKEGGWCTQQDSRALEYGSDGNKLHVLIGPDGSAKTQIMISEGYSGPTFYQLNKDVLEGPELAEVHDMWNSVSDTEQQYIREMKKVMDEKGIAYKEPPPSLPQISQIKGRFNDTNDPEHFLHVQDFIKRGEWSDIGDISNTGLVDLNDYMHGPKWEEVVKNFGRRYATEDEYNKLYIEAMSEAKP